MNNEEAVEIVGKLIRRHSQNPAANLADLFIDETLKKAVERLRATDPSHSGGWASSPGTCDPKIVAAVRLKVIKVLQTFTCDVLSSTTERAGAANVKLLLPLVTALRPSDDEQQQQLLMAVLTRHPTLQSHYLVASPLPLAPAASHKFLTSAAVMSKVLALIPALVAARAGQPQSLEFVRAIVVCRVFSLAFWSQAFAELKARSGSSFVGVVVLAVETAGLVLAVELLAASSPKGRNKKKD